MKQINKSHLLLIASAILVIASLPLLNFSSSTSTLNIGYVLNKITQDEKHVTRLYNLILSGSSEVTLNINNTKDQLNISNGIVVGNESSSQGNLSSIGGGNANIIENSNYAGIAGGANNRIENGDNSLIGGGAGNTINGVNGIIAGGTSNQVGSGTVVGGFKNKASGNGVALGGQNNNAQTNSLVMGTGAKGQKVFARNANTTDNSARIDAKNGVLIGTTDATPGVSLVVNGAVKINGDSNSSAAGIAGEIRVVNGCFYTYDGKYWHVISLANDPADCTGFASNETCVFGNVYLQQGDQVTGYNATISTSCNPKRVVCSGENLVTLDGNEGGYNNPYCYTVN